jgi:signal transduction histidine kinase
MLSVQEDVVQMRQLTKSLLEIAKTGSEGSIELNDVRIDEVLFKVMGDIKKINASYNVELNYDDSAEVENNFLVFGNADLLYISIRNLVENGCKYSSDQTSRVSLSFANKSAIIDVRNIGEPIQKEDMEKIFQPFYRSADAAGTQGFGLGLALSQRIVALHKGRLYLKSSDATGTVFTITLPVV